MIIVDTGFWVAVFNEKDRYHESAKNTLSQYPYEELITTGSVLTETSHLLLKRSSTIYRGVQNQIKFLSIFQLHPQQFKLFELQATHLTRITALMETYQNPPIDLADTSLVILAEELGEGRFFSIDNRDFKGLLDLGWNFLHGIPNCRGEKFFAPTATDVICHKFYLSP